MTAGGINKGNRFFGEPLNLSKLEDNRNSAGNNSGVKRRHLIKYRPKCLEIILKRLGDF